MRVTPPYSDERLRAALASMDLLDKRERMVRAKRNGSARRAYELKRLVARACKEGKWFRAAARGKTVPKFETAHRRLEELIVLVLHLGAKAELTELDLRQFFLSQRSALKPDPAKARNEHPYAVRRHETRTATERFVVCIRDTHRLLELGFDGQQLPLVSLQASIRYALAQLRTLARELSYAPEQFDARAGRLIGATTQARLRKAG